MQDNDLYMPPPKSDLFDVTEVEGAGRGVVASHPISKDEILLTCSEPAAHVVFREYRKETCAECFHYDRGRTLAVRHLDLGKVFCSDLCARAWHSRTGESGLNAWRSLESFVRANAKNSPPLSGELLESRPSRADVRQRWLEVSSNESSSQHGGSHSADGGKGSRQNGKARSVDADVLGFLLSAILSQHLYPDMWHQDVTSLVQDDTPYTTVVELKAHCESYRQLITLMPPELSSNGLVMTCQIAASAASHNAFGIRSGGNDNEEYMGYGVWTAASYFNHSCQPNVTKRRCRREWQFCAAEDVATGEQLCISYLGGDEEGMSVTDRRARLLKTWGFLCQCMRCAREAAQYHGIPDEH